VGAQRRVDLVELVDRHVRLLAGVVLPLGDALAGDVDDRLVGPAVLAVPAHDDRGRRDGVAGAVRAHVALGGLAQRRASWRWWLPRTSARRGGAARRIVARTS
jgi:hypothetical protein